jgi:hypothetical protein
MLARLRQKLAQEQLSAQVYEVDPEALPIEGVSPKLREAAPSAAQTLQRSFDEVPVTT